MENEKYSFRAFSLSNIAKLKIHLTIYSLMNIFLYFNDVYECNIMYLIQINNTNIYII